MINTLGDVITLGLLLAAAIVVPYKLAKAWVWPHVRPFVMSILPPPPASQDGVAAPVAATARNALPGSTEPSTSVNDPLPGNVVAGLVPVEARDIIRMQAHAETVVKLLGAAKFTNKAEAIEFVFSCSRSGRPNSKYQQAVKLVDELTERYPQRTPEQEQRRSELGLA